MSDEEKLDFTRKGIVKMYERLMNGEITNEEFHEAAANTETILREAGVDLSVRFMGSYEPEPESVEEWAKRLGLTFSSEKKQTTLGDYKEE